VVPVLVLPPQAGHDSCVVDFAPGQSQIETIRNVGLGTVASLDWIGATRATKDTTVEDYLAVIADAIGLLGGRVNLIGDCQGGWLGTIYAAH
jgi:poly(3-hydroxybutyrate) depolymerase